MSEPRDCYGRPIHPLSMNPRNKEQLRQRQIAERAAMSELKPGDWTATGKPEHCVKCDCELPAVSVRYYLTAYQPLADGYGSEGKAGPFCSTTCRGDLTTRPTPIPGYRERGYAQGVEAAYEAANACGGYAANDIEQAFCNGVQAAMDAIRHLSDLPAEWEAEDALDGTRPLPFTLDDGGRMVRMAWIRWAQEQPNPKPSWLLPYDELAEPDKEADRRIAEAVGRWTLILDAARQALAARPPQPDDFTRGWVACQREAKKIADYANERASRDWHDVRQVGAVQQVSSEISDAISSLTPPASAREGMESVENTALRNNIVEAARRFISGWAVVGIDSSRNHELLAQACGRYEQQQMASTPRTGDGG